MKNNHTRLKRLAAISLVLVMCLSVVPFMAPSASAVHFATILDEMADDELELMDYRPNGLGLFSIGSDGTCYSKSGTKLMSSQDPEGEKTLVHDFQTDVKSCHAYSHGALDYVFVSLTGEIWRSINGGQFTKVLDMSDGKYAYIWSWSHSTDGDRLIIGEYGNKSTPSKVYLTNDGGNTWSTLFDTASYKETAGSHIHLVAIDPYDRDTFYINVGDQPNVRGLFVSTDGGSTWARKSGANTLVSYCGEVANGHLACTFPDEDRVYFFSDNAPLIWEYRKSTGDLHLLAQLPNPYATHKAKTYSATMGEHGVSYFAMTDYVAGVNASYIWMTLDGTSFYRLNSHYLNTEIGNFPIQSYGGRIYANGLSFKDLTRDEYGQLIGEARSVEVHGDSMQHLNLKHPMKEVTLTITGKDTTNYVKNPSWEVGTAHWTGEGTTVLQIVDVARDGEKALSLSLQDGVSIGRLTQYCNVVLSGETLVIRASVMVSEPTSKAPQIYVWYKAPDTETKLMYIGTDDPAHHQGHLNEQMWTDLTYYWTPPAGVTLTAFGIQINEDVEYYIDRFSVSPDPIYVNKGTPSGNVSFMLGDRLIEAGELAGGESVTVSLPSDVWLDGVVPIVPVSGLAYTVSIDGTPVSESEQSIRETNKLLEQTIPLIIGLAVIGGLFTMIGKAFGRLKF